MATPLGMVQAFADAALAADSLPDLKALMAEAARAFGADYFLMVHHADFSREPAGLVRVGNYPEEFVQISRQDGRPLDDPIMEACEKSLTGFFWADVGAIVPLTDKHRRRAEQVSKTGLADGFVVPTHVPGEHLGSCHFATASGRQLQRAHSAALQTVATYGFEAARRLVRQGRRSPEAAAALTDRQRECIILSAKGKSDNVIGQLLGLSPKTVNSYMENAKRRYGVATRSQLIVRALYASDITFQDIVGPDGHGRAFAALH